MAVLGTKVHVPTLRRDLVERRRLTARLTERLAEGDLPRLVLVSAPAGFGKTTVLAQGLAPVAAGPGHVAWLSLDKDDNDPRRFLEHLVAALQTGGGFSEAAALVAAQGAPESALTSVVNELDLHAGRTVLVLDDYQVVVAPEVHAMVTFLLDHLPPQAALAIATRSDPPLPLPRLRARGELVELRAADLRFTPDEAGAFLTDVMGLDLSDAPDGCSPDPHGGVGHRAPACRSLAARERTTPLPSSPTSPAATGSSSTTSSTRSCVRSPSPRVGSCSRPPSCSS